eukprot:6674772-Prymnesium_polylepis.1
MPVTDCRQGPGDRGSVTYIPLINQSVRSDRIKRESSPKTRSDHETSDAAARPTAPSVLEIDVQRRLRASTPTSGLTRPSPG